MIFRLSHHALRSASGAALLLLVAACSESEPELPPLESAQMALERGDGVRAEKQLRDMLDAGAAREQVAAYLGKAELQQGNLAEARGWLASGEFDDSTRGLGFHTLGRVEMLEGNLPAAGQAFDRAYQSIPDDPGLWVDIGRLRYRGGEQSQAVEASKRAVELGPDNPRALQFRAQLIRDSRGMMAALPWFERALQISPDDPDFLYDYAVTLGEAGRAKDMLAAVRKMAKADPADRRIFWLQAVVAARGGKFDLARSLLLRSGDIDREMPAAMLLSGIIDLQNDNAATAAQTFDKLAALQPENNRVRMLLARALAQGGNHAELIYRFADDARRPNATPYLVTLVARALEASGERDQAAEFLDKAAQPRAGNLIVLRGNTALSVLQARAELEGELRGSETLSLVRNLIENGQRDDAVRQASAFSDSFGGFADGYGLMGDALLSAGRRDAALAAYGRAAEVRQTWPLSRRIFYANRAAGQIDQAENLVARYLAGDPANGEAANLLARLAFDRQDWDLAAILADHALAYGAGRDPHLLALRAQIALRRGEPNALAIAKRAQSIQPLNSMVNQTMALISSEHPRTSNKN